MESKEKECSLKAIICHLEVCLIHIGFIAVEMKALGNEYNESFKTSCEIHDSLRRFHKKVKAAQKLDSSQNS